MTVTWVYQSLSSRTVRETRGSFLMCSKRLRPWSMLTRTWSPRGRYYVAAETGCPSDLTVLITAGLALASIFLAASDNGDCDMRAGSFGAGGYTELATRSRARVAGSLSPSPMPGTGQRC